MKADVPMVHLPSDEAAGFLRLVPAGDKEPLGEGRTATTRAALEDACQQLAHSYEDVVEGLGGVEYLG